MASQSSSQKRRQANVRYSPANDGDVRTVSGNHPDIAHPETVRLLENIVRTDSRIQPEQTVPSQVVQNESQPTVNATFPSSPQVIVTRTVSTGKGAIPKIPKAKTATRNKSKRKSVYVTIRNDPSVRRNPPRRVRENRVSSCKLCHEPDNTAMVQCGECGSRFHFSCVEVSQSVEEISWSCPECASAYKRKTPRQISAPEMQGASENRQQFTSPPSVVVSSKSAGQSSRRSEKRKIELQLQKLEEEREWQQQYLKQKYSLLQELESDTSSKISHQDSMEENAAKIEQWIQNTEICGDDSGLVDVDPEDEPVLTNVQEAQRRSQRDQELQGEQNRDRLQITQLMSKLQVAERRAPSIANMSVQNNCTNHHDSSHQPPRPQIGLADADRRPTNSLRNIEPRQTTSERFQQCTGRTFGVQVPPSNLCEDPVLYQRRSQYLPNSELRPRAENRRETRFLTTAVDFAPRQRSTPVTQPRRRIPSAEPEIEDDATYTLNRSQLAARQAVSRDLPDFNGNPEDWPLFFSMFVSSTQLCGFSNEENMLRLRKCLKGKALEAVKCRMLHPSNVQGVISTLRMLYGRPETIIQAIVRKIRSLPSPNIEKLDTVIQFALSVENLVATVEACEIGDFMYNVSLRYELVERLPPTLKLDWARFSRDQPNPNLLDFSSWLRFVAEDASAVSISIDGDHRARTAKKDGFLNLHSEDSQQPLRKPSFTSVSSKPVSSKESIKECVGCKGSCLTLAQCKRFKELSYDSKWAVVRELNVCRKCLRQHNGPCKQKKECGTNGCSYLHHPLLHDAGRHTSAASQVPVRSSETQRNQTTSTSCNVHQGQSEILFRIVPVLLYGPSKVVRTYAFLDEGSELTLMEQSLADELGVQGPQNSLCLRWTGGTSRTEALSQKVNFQISSVTSPFKKFRLGEVHTVENLQLRPQTMLMDELQEKFQYLKGLPVESYREVSPRLLIGLDHASLGNVMKCREGKPNEPIAVKTRLGWMIFGCCSRTSTIANHINHHRVQLCQCETKSNEELHEAMKQYFSLESLGISKPSKLLLSNDDRRANELLRTLTRSTKGRYESGLLWRYDNVRLPDSRPMALRRWECLDRRMQRDEDLAQVLNEMISDYLAKGYIRKLTVEELETPCNRVWYLPIFPVVNPNKPGKTRLVWDAAAKIHGVCLNSALLKGPDLLVSLLSVLIRFREFRVAVSGDIREMYHQVLMRPVDQHCLRFLWKDNEDDTAPGTYVMQVMSYGACCSPSTAQYVKNTHAQQFEQEFPEAVHAIVHDHYVDDMLISVETEEKAIQLATEVKGIHECGGFEMRNWVSNVPAVVAALDGEKTNEKNLSIGETDTTEKVLGMWWDTTADCFTYKLSSRHDADLLSGLRRPTKREVLRTLMMVFDPLGLISHFLMFLRSLLQEIWRASIDWDERIQDCHFEKWLTWLQFLPCVADIKIPRCYRTVTSAEEGTIVQMHTFVDASENGFAAAVYLRFQEGNTVECTLAGAKTRVAPLKFLSIPRSELQAAVIGTMLADSIQESLSIKVEKRFFWTDSRDVMCWLHSDHRRYSQYVGVRISEVLETTALRDWRWVPTKLNVADDGTKWKNSPDFSASSRWFCGPEFLWKHEEQWPISLLTVKFTDTELRPHLHLHFKALEPIIDTSRFSQWRTMLKTTAYVFRAIRNMQRTARQFTKAYGPLTRDELIKAESYLHQTAQRSSYEEEIAILSTKHQEPSSKGISKGSPLFRLCPFMDEKGVLRIRGRTSACQVVDSSIVNPIILPREHSVTKLIVLDVHQRFLHQNHETAINELKQCYYISRLKAVYKSVRNNCQVCKNERACPEAPLMSDLPHARLAAYSRPFSHMGVDYFGPMMVTVGRRVEKRWGVLATCLTVRAIHLEIAHSLTTDSCIMALRNIIGRRGIPVAIYSDRGTNFVGASKELTTALEELEHDKIVAEFTSPHTTWIFIPPSSPHMGGAWERLIRSVKQNLEKLKPNRIPTDETLRNILIEVEYLVNSRPLTEIPLDDDQSPVLTPNHFVIGSSNGALPWTNLDDHPARLKLNWKLSQSATNQFWKQWVHDYLPTLTRRAKWFAEVKPIEINDIVIIVDANFPRSCWPKGRVIATKVAADGQVRQATVQTANGIYERPVIKLAVLDVGVGGNATQRELRRIEGGNVKGATSTSDLVTPMADVTTNICHTQRPTKGSTTERWSCK